MIAMTKGSYKVKRKNPVSADGAMQTKRFLDRFRFRNVERLGLDELPGMKSLTVEYMISSIDAAMAHEGLPLSRENKQMMKDCIDGKMTIHDAKAAMVARHSKTGGARTYDR